MWLPEPHPCAMLREAVWPAEVLLRQSGLPTEALLRPEAEDVLREEVVLPLALRLRPVRRFAWFVLLRLPLEVWLRRQAEELLRPEEVLLPFALWT